MGWFIIFQTIMRITRHTNTTLPTGPHMPRETNLVQCQTIGAKNLAHIKHGMHPSHASFYNTLRN